MKEPRLPPKFPDTARLAKAAYERSGCKNHGEFAGLLRIGVRTFRTRLAGDIDANDIIGFALEEVVAGRLLEASR